MILFFIVFTFLVTSGLYGVLLWLGCRKLAAHLRDNPAGREAVAEHVVMPLLGRGPDAKKESGPP
jgi:hypothetical protein